MKDETIVGNLVDLHNKIYGKQTKKLNFDLYFDETNNIRIVRLTSNGTNADIKNHFFVLGGIAIKNGTRLENNDVYSSIGLQSNVTEMKFKHLCPHRENFRSIIKSSKLLLFLEYLSTHSIYIHFHVFDFLYWALVDILDSLFDENDHNQTIYLMHYEILKSDFMEVLCTDYDELIKILYEYSFPNISKEKSSDFIKAIYNLYLNNISNYDDNLPENFYKEVLRQMIKTKLNKNELIFLKDNRDFVICDELEMVYLQSMSCFLNENKYFDEEISIKDKIEQIDSNYKIKLNCQWVNSKNNIYIQMSDCVCGFLSQIYKFISESSIQEIVTFVESMKKDDIEFKVLDNFYKLFNESERFYKFFVCRTIPEYLQCKFLYLFQLINKKH